MTDASQIPEKTFEYLDDSYRPSYCDDSYRQNMRTTADHPPNIGRAEMEILRYVSDHHPVSVRDVAEYVAATKGHVRTTVLNVMERLRKKGCLKRRKINGLFQYSPSVPKGDLLRSLVREFVERTLGGSLSPFVAYLTHEGKLSAGELAELRALVAEMERDKPAKSP
ncbi:MAG: BlaI/MecI/CopY family transcriptional regulator [Verrucomicrobiota bacterium]